MSETLNTLQAQGSAQTLKDMMRCGVLANENGEVMILHEQDLPAPIQWVEFDPDINSFVFIFENAEILEFGHVIHPQSEQHILNSGEITFCHVKKGEILKTWKTPFIAKHY